MKIQSEHKPREGSLRLTNKKWLFRQCRMVDSIKRLVTVALLSGKAMAFEWLDEETEYWQTADVSARTFNFSTDGLFNNSLLTIGVVVIVGIILFGKFSALWLILLLAINLDS